MKSVIMHIAKNFKPTLYTILILLLSLMFVAVPSPWRHHTIVHAQSLRTVEDKSKDTPATATKQTANAETKRNEDSLDVKLALGEQSPWTKYVTIYMTVTAKDHPIKALRINVDAPKQISGNVKPRGDLPLAQGESRTYTIKIKPAEAGTFNIAFEAIEWTTSTNYTSSKNYAFTFDNNLLLVPRTPKYGQNLAIKYAILAVAGILAIFALLIAGKIGLRKLKAFMAPPNV